MVIAWRSSPASLCRAVASHRLRLPDRDLFAWAEAPRK
jgi:hypothetical protein